MRDNQSEQLASCVVAELARVRKERGISHEKLAEMAGLSRASISYIENNKRNPTLLSCLKIARALDVDLAEVIKTNQQG